MKISDDLELRVAEILSKLKIRFFHEGDKENYQRLDFYLPDFDIYIEIKKFHSVRTAKQLKSEDNIILIQGRKSVEFLEQIIKVKLIN